MSTNIQPVTPPSHVSVMVSEAEAAIRERVTALETAARADELKVKSWIAKQWPHFVTWAAVAAPYVLKHLP